MSENKKLRPGILVKARASKDATPDGQVYLLGKDRLTYVDVDGSFNYKMRPASDDNLAALPTIEDTREFIARALNFAGVDLATKAKLENEVMLALVEIRDSYYEPSLAEEMYQESRVVEGDWPAWDNLTNAEKMGWEKAAHVKESYDKLLERAGMKMMDISPSVKGPDYNVGGVVKRRPIKDTPQA